MKILFKEKNFKKESLFLINQINEIIEEYSMLGYSLTLRQVYYQLVARTIIPNNERSYKNTGNLINDARMAGLISWSAIEDRTRNLKKNGHWNDPSSILSSAAFSYHKDHWEDQESYIEVWVEKDALIGIIGNISSKLDVSHFSCRGYVSASEMFYAAQRLKKYSDEGKEIVLLHLGDHDPSGQDMSRDIVDRLEIFGVKNLKFKRLALNLNQIEEYNPPPNPTKLNDSRASNYISKFGYESWELDALEPNVLESLIEKNVSRYINKKTLNQLLHTENKEKEKLKDLALHWSLVEKNWSKIKKMVKEENV